MAAYIALSVMATLFDVLFENAGLKLIGMGKVRNRYELPGHPNKMLVVATNRISVYDFVLGSLVKMKGAVLTAMTVFFHIHVLRPAGFKTDLVAYGSGIDKYLPKSLRGNVELQKVALVVEKKKMADVEAVFRFFLTGSAYKAYIKESNRRIVNGNRLPAGLYDGARLPKGVFTPTTKAEKGHDLALRHQDVARKYPWMERLALKAAHVCAEYLLTVGIVLCDGKWEFGIDGSLNDELVTPDSCRLWHEDDVAAAAVTRTVPPSRDKQRGRNFAKTIVAFGETGLDQLDPENPEHQEFAGSVQLPDDVSSDITNTYLQIFERVTRKSIEQFWVEDMGIAA